MAATGLTSDADNCTQQLRWKGVGCGEGEGVDPRWSGSDLSLLEAEFIKFSC
jgi:hypothetical protein